MTTSKLGFTSKALPIACIAVALMACDAEPQGNPVEVGSVRWGRDLDTALTASDRTGRPVFVLFQEIPGCTRCRLFGQRVLTSPLLVEAIEDEFHPVLVSNNRSAGMDSELLDRFKEPAWNYQVVRFLDAEGHDATPRRDRIWSIGVITSRMIEAIEAVERPLPRYLEAVPGLTKMQKTKINAFICSDRSEALGWLSPRQQRPLAAARG